MKIGTKKAFLIEQLGRVYWGHYINCSQFDDPHDIYNVVHKPTSLKLGELVILRLVKEKRHTPESTPGENSSYTWRIWERAEEENEEAPTESAPPV